MFTRNITGPTKEKLKCQLYLLQRLLSTQIAVKTSSYYEDALDYKCIPGPSIFSFIRDFMPGGKFHDSSFNDYALEMRKLYGDIFVLPGLFGKPDSVMLFNTKDIETVYRNEGQWPYRESFGTYRHYRGVVKKDFFQGTVGVVAGQGEAWGKMRSKINPVLMKPQNLYMYLKPLQQISFDFIERIKQIRDPQILEVPENFDYEVKRLTFETVALVALNRRLGLVSETSQNPEAEEIIKNTRLIFHYSFLLDVQPSIWRTIRTPTYYKCMQVHENIFNICMNFINQTLKEIEEKGKGKEAGTGTAEERYSVLEQLLLIDKKLAVVTAMDMLLAGVDTTSVSLLAILLCLAKNPDKQQKLREEILKVMPNKDSPITEENFKNLPYLRAVIKEVLRMYPNGVGSYRNPMQDTVLSGYKVPKGTNVAMYFNILMMDETNFPQAKQFLPERWLHDHRSKEGKINPFIYWPFGIGPRICVGKRFAELEMEVITMCLIRNFEVEFNHDASKPFKGNIINIPAIPMRFTFKNIEN